MKALRMVLAMSCLALYASAAIAAEPADVGNGSTVVNIKLLEGTADLVGPISDASPTDLDGFQSQEVGVGLELIHFPKEHFAYNLAGGIGFWQETDTSADGTAAGDVEKHIVSWQARVGFDYVAHLAENRLHLFVGPGVQYWSGKPKIEQGGVKVEGETTNRVALHGRMGAHLAISRTVGLFGDMGHYVGRASASSSAGAKAKWWATGRTGSMGLSLNF
jgi:hypothetical protein